MEVAEPAMASLDHLPSEIIHTIFCYANASDLGALARTCRHFNDHIRGNAFLCRHHYLKAHDPPLPVDDGGNEIDWVKELHEVARLDRLLASADRDYKRQHFKESAHAIIKLLKSANPLLDHPRNRVFLQSHFLTQEDANAHVFLCSSELFGRAGDPDYHSPRDSEEERQLAAKLHVLYGVPIDWDKYNLEDHCKPTHPFARSKVYDLREYTTGSLWGPFRNDGSGNVDWQKLEAIMVVLGFNLRIMERRTHGALESEFSKPWFGVCPGSWTPSSKLAHLNSLVPRNKTPLVEADPYNVTGTWLRVVCFLDYSDLHAFNFAGEPPPPDEPRVPIDTEEATRMIILSLVVTAITDAGPDDMPGTKVVEYKGRSRSMHDQWDLNANSSIRGAVRTTREGEVRFTHTDTMRGASEERWRSEGIHVGGAQSARGVLGTWFDKDFDPEGPAGPTAYWKVSDKLYLRGGDENLQDDAAESDDDGDGDGDGSG